VNTGGLMVGYLKENGLIIKWMVKEYSVGQMEENMMVSIKWIKKKALEYFNGLTIEGM
jgi:hypothetical protein